MFDLTFLTTLKDSTGIMNMGTEWIMIGICLLLLWLAIKKEFEPLLLVPIGFGGLLANIPVADIANAETNGFLGIIYETGVANGLFPLLIFMGVGAMTDFALLIAHPKTALPGAAAQFGIFTTLIGALALSAYVPGIDFSLQDAAAIGIIGGADGPTKPSFWPADCPTSIWELLRLRRILTWRSYHYSTPCDETAHHQNRTCH